MVRYVVNWDTIPTSNTGECWSQVRCGVASVKVLDGVRLYILLGFSLVLLD